MCREPVGRCSRTAAIVAVWPGAGAFDGEAFQGERLLTGFVQNGDQVEHPKIDGDSLGRECVQGDRRLEVEAAAVEVRTQLLVYQGVQPGQLQPTHFQPCFAAAAADVDGAAQVERQRVVDGQGAIEGAVSAAGPGERRRAQAQRCYLHHVGCEVRGAPGDATVVEGELGDGDFPVRSRLRIVRAARGIRFWRRSIRRRRREDLAEADRLVAIKTGDIEAVQGDCPDAGARLGEAGIDGAHVEGCEAHVGVGVTLGIGGRDVDGVQTQAAVLDVERRGR